MALLVKGVTLALLLTRLGGTAPAAPAAPAGEARVVVVVATRVNVEVDEARRLAVLVASAVERHLLVRAVASEAEAPDDCPGDRECLAALGARVGADELLLLALVRLGGSLKVEAIWVETSTGRAAVRDPLLFAGREPPDVGARAAARLLPHAARRSAERSPDAAGTRAIPIALATAGAVALTGSLAYRHRSRRAGGCRRCVDERDATRADLLLGTALIAGAAALALHLHDRARRPPRAAIGLAPAAGGAVLSWGGEF